MELIQCLPILFEYFYYGNLDENTMLFMIIAFNSSKIICFSYYIYNISVYKKGTWCDSCCNLIPFIFFLITLTPLPLFPFMTITYKSLFEKRVLLLDQNKNKLKQDGTKVLINTTPTTHITRATHTVGSSNGYHKTITDPPTEETSYDDRTEDFEDEDDDMKMSELNESTPIHKLSTPSVQGQEDLRRYLTMESFAGSSIISGNSMNGHNVNKTANKSNSGIHFDAHDSMKSIKCQYVLLCLYLLLAYIGCNAWLIINCGDMFCLGFKTQIMIYVTIGFVFLAIIIYSPCVLKRMLNRSQLVLIGEEFIYDDWAWL